MNAQLAPVNLVQLQQLTRLTWDGNLISSAARDELVKAGLVEHSWGYNWLTKSGVQVLNILGCLKPGSADEKE